MIILGLDPGFARTGYGIIKKEGDKIKVMDYGCITTKAGIDFTDRLVQINQDVQKLIKTSTPVHCAIESLFFFKNTKTALSVASARGVLMFTAKKNKLKVFEYTPLEVKQAVTGYGRAEKIQVMKMVKNILRIKSKIKLDDTSDALAVAICHASSVKCLL